MWLLIGVLDFKQSGSAYRHGGHGLRQMNRGGEEGLQMETYALLAERFPNGLSELPELPEERSGEVSRQDLGQANADSSRQMKQDRSNGAVLEAAVL